MKKTRFGIIGTGFITDWVIAGGREDERFEVAGIYSRTADRAKEYAGKHHIPRTYTSIETMAADPQIDAVYIASPNACHAAQSILCMNHGKHVLCEKPLASNAAEARQMQQAAADNHTVLMEAMKPTLTPAFRAIREALPEIGTVRQYFSCYCQYSSRYDKLREGTVLNAFQPELSNGAVMDIGVYTLYPMVVLFGRPTQIQAAAVKLYSGVDGHGSVNFSYPSGMNATVLYSKIADSRLPTEIQGEEGRITVDRINIIGEATLTRRNRDSRSLLPVVRKNEYYYEVAEFIDLVQSGRKQSTINSLEASCITLEITDEIRRQAGVVFPADSR